jgi:hypothetical protein
MTTQHDPENQEPFDDIPFVDDKDEAFDPQPPKRSKPKSFGEARGRWLDAVFHDERVSHAFRVAYGLVTKLLLMKSNPKRCYPLGYPRLAAETLVSPKTAERSIKVLRETGYIRTHQPSGKSRLTIFPIFDLELAQARQNDELADQARHQARHVDSNSAENSEGLRGRSQYSQDSHISRPGDDSPRYYEQEHTIPVYNQAAAPDWPHAPDPPESEPDEFEQKERAA